MNIPKDHQLYEEVKDLVKRRVKVWPSAYASGQLVREYKLAYAAKYGNNNAYVGENANRNTNKRGDGNLTRWFDEKWVNVCDKDANGNYIPCGRKSASLVSSDYPYCRPTYKISRSTPKTVSEFTTDEVIAMCYLKRSMEQGVQGRPTRIYHSTYQLGGGEITANVRELSDEERAKSSNKHKKYAVDVISDNQHKTVYFGHNQYEDYTLHHDPNRMENYVKRHQRRENWDLDGIDTPGFWSRWLLWNKPSFNDSLEDIEKRFKVHVNNITLRAD